MKRLVMALLLALAPAAVSAQEPSSEARRAALEARRDSLEAEVVQKFLARLTRDLRLSSEQVSQTERVLRESGVRRRDLTRASYELRGRLYRAARDEAATDADFERLLAEHEALRVREHDMWRRDQEELARILVPRQRVQFLLSWSRFQDDMREILSRRSREQGDRREHRPNGPSH